MLSRKNRRHGEEFKRLASERVERLFELAEDVHGRHPELADRYAREAWRLKTRFNLKLAPNLKRKFCRGCLSYMKPGSSCRVRIKSGRLTVTCLRCGRVTRIPYKG
jgi:ribonuclease P protein subunit RPR2